jgi:hypothetical protein
VHAGEPQPAQFDKDQISPHARIGGFQSSLSRLFGQPIKLAGFIAQLLKHGGCSCG